jgi:hypothetical protein
MKLMSSLFLFAWVCRAGGGLGLADWPARLKLDLSCTSFCILLDTLLGASKALVGDFARFFRSSVLKGAAYFYVILFVYY